MVLRDSAACCAALTGHLLCDLDRNAEISVQDVICCQSSVDV